VPKRLVITETFHGPTFLLKLSCAIFLPGWKV
jgi:hypothetical protein